jgi:hypothetical protein
MLDAGQRHNAGSRQNPTAYEVGGRGKAHEIYRASVFAPQRDNTCGDRPLQKRGSKTMSITFEVRLLRGSG